MVYCLDRLSRNATHGVIFRDELDKHHVILESVTEDIDKTPLGEAITYLRGTFSQIEAEKIRERTMRGKRAKVREGKYPQGAGLGVYGYDWDATNKKRVMNEYEARIVIRIFTLLSEGYTRMDIARTFNEQGIRTKGGRSWYRGTIERIITNKAYIGITTYCGIELPEVTPPIIGGELFDRANEALKRSKELRKGRPKVSYLLTSHITCGKCGKPIVGSSTKHYRYYYCSEAFNREYKAKTCDARRIVADIVETSTWSKVESILKNPDLLMQQIREMVDSENDKVNQATLDKEITSLRRKAKGYSADERSLLSLFRHKQIGRDALLDEINQLKQDREQDEQKLAELTQSHRKMASLVDAEFKIGEYCSTVLHNLDNLTYEDKRLALDALDVKVVATKEGFQITATLPIEISDKSEQAVVANVHSSK